MNFLKKTTGLLRVQILKMAKKKKTDFKEVPSDACCRTIGNDVMYNKKQQLECSEPYEDLNTSDTDTQSTFEKYKDKSKRYKRLRIISSSSSDSGCEHIRNASSKGGQGGDKNPHDYNCNNSLSSDELHTSENFNEKPSETKQKSLSENKDRGCEKIKVRSYIADKEGGIKNKRKYDERHCCYFCHKLVHKISKHLELVHKEEADVAKIMATPKNSRQRRDAYSALRRVGDYYHNTEVIATKNGELILIRRPTENEGRFVSFVDFGPCPHCLGFLLKKHIWHHIKHSCNMNKQNLDRKLALAESSALLHHSLGNTVPSDFSKNVLQKLKGSDIPYLCRNDELILRFGIFQWDKYKVTNYDLVRQTMRQLARLLVEFRKTGKQNKASLSDCLIPENFDTLVDSVKQLCKETDNETERPTLENAPSLALKLGHNLRKCANLERGRALRVRDMAKDTALQGFLHLMSWEWSHKVSSTALSTLKRKRFNTEDLLPLTTDLKKLNNYIKTQMATLINKIKGEFKEETWHKLKEVTLTRVMIFNKRRSGESARIRLKEYYSEVDWMRGNTEELKNTFTPLEMHLSKTLKLVNVIGKRERKVPVIITPDCLEAISTLKEFRNLVTTVFQDNMYLFPGINSDFPLRGDKVLRKICNSAKLQEPDLITSTKLRKYMATVIQIFDLSENETDWVARHLGHDIRIHREYYRLQESSVELTKVSRLLMVVDEGRAADFQNKPLDSIALEDLPPIHESEEEEAEEDQPSTLTNNIFGQVIEEKTPRINPAKDNRGKVSKKRPRLDSDTKLTILKAFRKNIKRGIVPNKEECCQFLQNQPCMNKTWRNIKDCVHNHIVSLNKGKNKSNLLASSN